MSTLAIKVKEIRYCDECGSTEEVSHWTVEGEKGAARMDLCSEHDRYLKEFLRSFPVKGRQVLTRAQLQARRRLS